MVDLARLAECYEMRVTTLSDGRGGYKPAVVATPKTRTLPRTDEAFSHLLAAHVCNRAEARAWSVKTDLVCGVSVELPSCTDNEIRKTETILRKVVRDVVSAAQNVVEGRQSVDRYSFRI